ncbi:protein FAM237A-like [Denticeps clupeoides]|uniref:protein FAM237A-like n=1 Tax=Denticeps clupeoides TaxID=299321 RepID=UPI0010A2D726|nr:protein FAM237A [Denticeps clupeoides]
MHSGDTSKVTGDPRSTSHLKNTGVRLLQMTGFLGALHGSGMAWLWLTLAVASAAAFPTHLLGSLGEMNRECWDAASLTVIRSRKLRLGESVDELWDFMTYLRTQPQETHHELFMELAQFFWERYVDCVLARAHGLGKRAGGY